MQRVRSNSIPKNWDPDKEIDNLIQQHLQYMEPQSSLRRSQPFAESFPSTIPVNQPNKRNRSASNDSYALVIEGSPFELNWDPKDIAADCKDMANV